jgi:hypothetical protein
LAAQQEMIATVITQATQSFIEHVLSVLITVKMNLRWWSTGWTTWGLTWWQIKPSTQAAAKKRFSSLM